MSHMQPKTARAINGSKGPISLPAFEKRPKLYSFPTPAKLKIEAPAYLPTLIEKMDPIPEKVLIVLLIVTNFGKFSHLWRIHRYELCQWKLMEHWLLA